MAKEANQQVSISKPGNLAVTVPKVAKAKRQRVKVES